MSATRLSFKGVIVLYPILLLIAVFVVLSVPTDKGTGRGCRWFWAWTATGALFVFSFFSAFSIGLFLLPLAAVALVTIAWYSPHRAERTGVAAGAGFVLLLIAYLHRSGQDGLDPTPWLVGGLAFSAAAIVAYVLFGHTRRA
jgi:hypothetical protein